WLGGHERQLSWLGGHERQLSWPGPKNASQAGIGRNEQTQKERPERSGLFAFKKRSNGVGLNLT
ncbi:MAG: hypothetical protein ABJD57_04230, partial [Roseibium sp.]|uniref:hypothetical protein n=1 Tax=Roseibium sp. TaxID=1936156 RepID=UPI003264F352